MIQMDSAENFTFNYQDKVASAHWRSTSVTIYTTMLQFRENSVPRVIVSDNKDHNKNTVIHCSYTSLKFCKELFGEEIKKIIIWTDGPKSQYKNKFSCSYIGNNLQKLFPNYNITWNYSATSHGKCPVDGLGGTVKRTTAKKINSQKAIIKDTKSFVEAVLPEAKIYVVYLLKEDIEAALTETQAELLWESVSGVTGKHHAHFIAPHADGIFT